MENLKAEKTHVVELRSEKVRSIVGQIPSALTRHGIAIIGLVLLVLVLVAGFLPYRKVYSGVAVIHAIPSLDTSNADSVLLALRLQFGERRPTPLPPNASYPISLQTESGLLRGDLLSLSPRRDTAARQQALCRLPKVGVDSLAHSQVDFTLTVEDGTILSQFWGEK